MRVANEVSNDIRAAKKLRLPWWGVLCIIIGGLPIIWLFDHFGKLNLFLPVFNWVAVLGFMLVVKWNLRRHAWFWITWTVIAAVHVPLILFVPWTTKWVPALAIGGIDSLDFCAIIWIIDFIGKFAGGPEPVREEIPQTNAHKRRR
jgi:hypothetical protein